MSVQGDTLRSLRRNRGLTRTQLSDATAGCGARVPERTIAIIEAGLRIPAPAMLIVLASALEVSPNGLLEAHHEDLRRRAPMNAIAALVTASTLRKARVAAATLAMGTAAVGGGVLIDRALVTPDAGAATSPSGIEEPDPSTPGRRSQPLAEPPRAASVPHPSLPGARDLSPSRDANQSTAGSPLPDVQLGLPALDEPSVALLGEIVPPLDMLPVDLPPVDVPPVDVPPLDVPSVDLPPVDVPPVDVPPLDVPLVDVPVEKLPPLAPASIRVAVDDIAGGVIP